MKPKDIEPLDSRSRWHGYQEWYSNDNTIWVRGVNLHGKSIGYRENHQLKKTTFYIR